MNLAECISKLKKENNTGIFSIDINRKKKFLSYKELYNNSLYKLFDLQKEDIGCNEIIILQIDEIEEYFTAFWACILGGYIPIPLSPIKRKEDIDRLLNICSSLSDYRILANYNLEKTLNDFGKSGIIDTSLIIDYTTFNNKYKGKCLEVADNDLAFIQYSSGTTGNPKGVMCNEKAVLTNAYDIISKYKIDKNASMASWMPLYHNASLILFHIVPMICGINQFHIKTDDFIEDPLIWLDTIAENRITITISPNFGYKYLLDNIDENMKWDLSSLNMIVNAAEPISEELCIEFYKALKESSIKDNVIYPSYGLTEAMLLVSSTNEIKSINVDNRFMNIGEDIRILSENTNESCKYVSVGTMVDNYQVRIVGNNNEVFQDKKVGLIQIKGPSVTSGYYNNVKLTDELFKEQWLNTGDIGFLFEKELYVVGRAKEVIIINGKNYYPQDIEKKLEQKINDKSLAFIAASYKNSDFGTEQCVIFAKGISHNKFKNLKNDIIKILGNYFGIGSVIIVPVIDFVVNKTGKIMRNKMIENYISGVYEKQNIQHCCMDTSNNDEIIKNSDYAFLKEAWCNVLNINNIKMEDNFFELGGNSIKITKLYKILKEKYNINVYDLYKNNSFFELYKHLSKCRKTSLNKKSDKFERKEFMKKNDIAIVGVSFNFPKAKNLQDLYNVLFEGKCVIEKLPHKRIGDFKSLMDVDNNDNYGGFIEDIDKFDPLFFGISPLEAMYMDPQQRLLLMHSYMALMDSGIDPISIKGSNTGVFISAMDDDYNKLLEKASMEIEGFSPIGRVPSVIANRISYFYDINGPSEIVETACSSSLVAMDHAVNAIANDSCDMAILGASNLILTPTNNISFSKAGMLSKKGMCNTFSKDADGYVRSEGVAVLVLKKLQDAINDNNNIYAVIKGTAVNHGGRANTFTTPNPKSQEEVINKAITKSGIRKCDISYIETHGTGTPLGDPIEVNALKAVFGNNSCTLGSVKENIGHLEVASGMAGVIKVLLQMKYKTIFKNINITEINPLIEIEKTNFNINLENIPWNPKDSLGNPIKRIAGISSFGFGGTNAHVILEEYNNGTKDISRPQWPFKCKSFWPEINSNKETISSDDANVFSIEFKEKNLKYKGNINNIDLLILTNGNCEEKISILKGIYENVNVINLEDDYYVNEQKLSIISNIKTIVYLDKETKNNISLETLEKGNIELSLYKILKVLDKKITSDNVDFYFIYNNKYPYNKTVNPNGAGVIGISYSLCQSDDRYNVYNIDIDYSEDFSKNIEKIFNLSFNTKGTIYRISNEKVYMMSLENKSMLIDVRKDFKENGTYVFIGGSGSVSKNISKNLIEEFNCNVVWLGRSDESSSKVQEALGSFNKHGKKPIYISADVTDINSLEQALIKIKEIYSCINGVVFSAVDFSFNSSIYDIDYETLQKDINIKLLGTINTYKCFGKENLDFLCYFSSIQAFPFTEARYSMSYACGITAADSIVNYIKSVDSKINIGIINWGYWDVSSDKMSSKDIKYISLNEGYEFFKKFITGYLQNGINEISYFNNNITENKINDDYIVCSIVKCVLDELNAFDKENTRVIKKYSRLVEDIIKTLSLNNIYKETLINKEESLNNFNKYIEVLKSDKNTIGRGNLLSKCIENLKDILSGEVLATDIIFPNGSMELVENVYNNNAQADYCNNIVSQLILDKLKNHNSHCKFNILEIGAGTGGTTIPVLDKIKNYSDIFEYYYTDISKSFLLFGEDKLGKSVNYKILNIEEDISKQGYAEKSIDLIFASNVIHATRNINNSLNNINKLLKDDGILILNEMVKKEVFSLLTFGLLDGWWMYEDEDARIEGSPLLDKERWHRSLSLANFKNIETHYKDFNDCQSVLQAKKNKDCSIDPSNVSSIIMDILSQCLKIDKCEIDEETSFKDYGIDSILGIKFINKINEKFHIKLNTVIIFDYSNAHLLSKYICENFGNSIKQINSLNTENNEINSKENIIDYSSNTEQIKSVHNEEQVDVAVIGMAVNVPEADNVDEFLKNIIECKESIVELDENYLSLQYYSKNKEKGKSYTNRCGIIKNKNTFDGAKFKIYPKEVEAMNYHQKLILTESYNAIENAGYNPKELNGKRIGVYIGAEPTTKKNITYTGDSDALVASRLSYFLNLTGPTMVLNTGCSSSATALHIACQAIRNKEIDTAIVGGVYADLNEKTLALLSQVEMLSFSGKCMTFDESADGTVLSEGVGVVVLKALNKAKKDKDNICGIIKADYANQDGASNGISAPNGLAQEELIKTTYEKYNINPENIQYIETHGTGTSLGDPIEVNALVRAYKHFTNKKSYCNLGSLKPNIGHTAAASGIIGLIKVILCMNKGIIPALGNYKKINPLIEIKDSPFYITTDLINWPRINNKPRMAAINSFGHSGTNNHFVVEEYIDNFYTEKKSIINDNYKKNLLHNNTLFIEEKLISKDISSDTVNSHEYKNIAILFNVKNNLEKNENITVIDISHRETTCDINNNLLFEQFKGDSLKIVNAIRKIIHEYYGKKVFIQLYVDRNKTNVMGLEGIFETICLEEPNIKYKIVNIYGYEKFNINKEIKVFDYKSIYYYDEKRFAKTLMEINSESTTSNPWKDNGVYLIIGGYLGIGSLIAKRIMENTSNSKIIICSRNISEDIEELKGNLLIKKKCDVTNAMEINKLTEYIYSNYETLTGVFYLAGINKDNYFINKSNEEIVEVLKPKSLGLITVIEALKDKKVDFLCSFSSLSSIIGNIGQADYALANGSVNEIMSSIKYGINICWPYWKDGNMKISMKKLDEMRNNYGTKELESEYALDILETIISSKRKSTIVTYGNKELLKKTIVDSKKIQISGGDIKESMNNDINEYIQDKIVDKIKALLSQITEIPYNDLDENESIENYGMDSVVIMELNDKLKRHFNGIPKSLFYRFKTINEIASYLVNDYYNECVNWTGINANNVTHKDNKSEKVEQKVEMVEESSNAQKDDVAIIGISGKFGKCDNLDELWNMLENNEDSISQIPKDRWSLEGFYEKDMDKAIKEGKSYCKDGVFINGYSEFEPGFFNISPREAINMDPQERKLLEMSWNCLEDAGYSRDRLKESINNNIGVFIGVTKSGYNLYGQNIIENGQRTNPYTSFASMANRISFFLDANGPSITIDTMCSSSLVALHEAILSLNNKECKSALVGGVNIYLHPSNYVWLSSQRMLSPSGKCKSFGKGADGFVPGEGVGVVMLKPLKDAIRDKDSIYGIIKGTTINHGGRTNGYTVPNPNAQTNLILNAIEKSKVNPREISYVEAHGTGTNLGDPIELEAISTAYEKYTKDKGYCSIGSIKSNIGHLEAASGIAGLIKILLQMKNGKIVSSLNAEEINPNIDFDNSPFKLARNNTNWLREDINGKEKPRIAAISSFGAGGVNAHAIIEEYIDSSKFNNEKHEENIIILSAKTKYSLIERVKSLKTYITNNKNVSIENIAYTLQIGRDQMEERVAFIVANLQDLQEKLNIFIKNEQTSQGIFTSNFKFDKETINNFNYDEDMNCTLRLWIKKKKYKKVLELWVKGVNINWSDLYEGNYKIVNLPGYSFEKTSYTVINSEKSFDTNVVNNADNVVTKDNININVQKEVIVNNKKNELEDNIVYNNSKGKIVLEDKNSIDFNNLKVNIPNEKIKLEPLNSSLDINEKEDDKNDLLINEKNSVDNFSSEENSSLENIKNYLLLSLAELLFIKKESIDLESNFIDIGLDSVIGVEWIQNINKKYAISIPVTKIYDYCNINKLSSYILENINSSNIHNSEISDISVLKTEENINKYEDNIKDISNNEKLEIQKYIVNSLAEILFEKPEKIDITKNFLELGLDSVIGVEWIQNLNNNFAISLPATIIYDYSNIQELSKHIESLIISNDNKDNISFDKALKLIQSGEITLEEGEKLLERISE